MEKERSTGTARVLVLAGLLTAAPAVLAAQETEDLPAGDFAEELSVEVISVEVYVTDRKGRPVAGLTREDFRLFEDGDPVEIAYFSAYDAGAPATSDGGRAEAGDPAAEVPPEGREARNLVIYLDDANLAPAGRRRVLEGLRDVVAAGEDGADRIMVVVRDAGLTIVQPFTDDRQAVVDALDAVAGRATGGIFRGTERDAVFRAIREIHQGYESSNRCPDACDCGWHEMEARAREYADSVAGHVNAAAGALSQLSSALSGVGGRKFVLYVADGLEQRAGIDAFHYVADVCPQYEQEISRNYLTYDQASTFHRLTAHANANGVTFHTLEAFGLQADGSATESHSKYRTSILTQRLQAANRQSPLFQIANDTGGRAVLNANVFDREIERIGGDFGTYYSLGFESHHRGDGRLHRIQVEVGGRGYQVRHRTYYRDKPIETRLAERVWGTLLLGTETNSLGLAVTAGEARSGSSGCCSVPVELRLPVDRLSLAPGTESDVGRVYVVMTAKNDAGETISVRGREIPVRAAADDAGSDELRTLVVDVDLAPGSWELAVGVLDLLGGGESYVRERVEVATAASETSPPAPRI